MKKLLLLTTIVLAVAAVGMLAPMTEEAYAFPSLYDSNCLACHSDDPQTCAGCHAHGTHSSDAKNDIDVTATTDKTTYAPGETVSVSITGGYRAGWVRAILYDESGVEVARASGACDNPSLADHGCGNGPTFPGPIILNGTAPSTPGTYTFTGSWYGNQYDLGQEGGTTFFGPGWTPDATNPGHGEEKVSTNSFTVAAPAGAVMTVTDSVAPADDHSVPFGNVTVGTTAEQTVTVSNTGNATMTVGTITPPAAPFSLPADNCSGQTVAPAADCTITVRFSPTAATASSDSFDITSDGSPSLVTVQLSGTGVAAAVPDISVTDSVAPADDHSVPFGSVTEGTTSSPAVVTIENIGSANLLVSGIALSGADASDFVLDLNGGTSPCGSATPTLAASASCTVTAEFAPATTGAKSAALSIASNDPDTPTVDVALSGTGLAAGANNPPSTPQLVSPADGQTGLPTTTTLYWNRATDPDGDSVTYDLFVCTDSTFEACPSPENSTPIASASAGGEGYLAWALGAMALGLAFAGGLGRRRWIALLLAAALLAGVLLVACGDDDETTRIRSDLSFTVSGLQPDTTYFWKVVASDGVDSTDSAVRSFTTKQ
jgi:hypothetical protein